MFLNHTILRLLVPLALVALLAAACGGTPTTTTTGGGTPAATTAPTTAPTSAPTTAPTTAPTSPVSTSSALISTRQAIVDGKMETILTNAQGITLYYRDINIEVGTPQEQICTGSCAQTWPPLISHSCTPTSSTPLPGKLTVINDENGVQVEYQGIPLNTYVNDTKPGDTNGNGMGTLTTGNWHVVTPDVMRFAGPIMPVPTPGAWCGQ